MAESENVAGAAEEQAGDLTEVAERAEELTSSAEYLGGGLENFETDAEHEFVFQTGAEIPELGASGDGESEGVDDTADRNASDSPPDGED